jgi:uracil-DNA glycosylase family 4
MDRMSKTAAWKILDLFEDYATGGFMRRTRTGIEESGSLTAGSEPHPAVISDRAAEIASIAGEAEACTRCALSMNRRRTVPGEGAMDPAVLLVGEGPGEEEDATGRPFVGRSGQYLDTWLRPIGLERSRCYIANCVKCRPPQNREPHPEEIKACLPFLERQIEALRPKSILCLGRIAAHTLLEISTGISGLRARLHSRKGIPLVVTYHPSAVLRDPSLRRPVWEDLKLLKTLF